MGLGVRLRWELGGELEWLGLDAVGAEVGLGIDASIDVRCQGSALSILAVRITSQQQIANATVTSRNQQGQANNP